MQESDLDAEEDEHTILLVNQGPRSIEYAVPSQSADMGYLVNLSWAGRKLSARCECLAYEDYGHCKHIIAAVLELTWPRFAAPEPGTEFSRSQPRSWVMPGSLGSTVRRYS